MAQTHENTILNLIRVQDKLAPEMVRAIQLLIEDLYKIHEEVFPTTPPAPGEFGGAAKILGAVQNFTATAYPDNLRLDWDNLSGAFRYQIKQGLVWDTAKPIVVTATDVANVDPVFLNLIYGTYIFFISAWNIDGVPGEVTSTSLTIPQIGPPDLSLEVVVSTVLLRWTVPASSWRINHFIIYKDGLEIGRVFGTFKLIQEQVGGTYAYSVRAVDIVGNESLMSATKTADLHDPSEFEFVDELSADYTGIYVRTDFAILDNIPGVIGPVYVHTWEEHYVFFDFDSPQDQVDKGYPYYYQPSYVGGTPGPTYSEQVIADGASNYWKLDEVSGLTAIDVIGGANGAINGGVTLNQPGAIVDGKSMLFNGAAGTRIEIPANSFYKPGTGPVSIECWIKTPTSQGFKYPIDFKNNGASGFSGLGFLTGGAGQIYLDLFLGLTGSSIGNTANYYDNNWHHLVGTITRGATDIGRIYFDGVLLAELALPLNGESLTSNVPAGIGSYSAGGANNFAGNIDEVAIYPLALTPAQIANHYALRNAVSNPIATYEETFDFGEIYKNLTVVIDYNQLQINGSTLISTQLSYSDDSITWSEPVIGISTLAPSFRYVKVLWTFENADDKSVAFISNLRIVLNVTLTLDSGSIDCLFNDAGGTLVTYNKDFTGISSVTATASVSLQPLYCVCDQVTKDSFRILVFDSSGNRESANVSWKARGVI